MRLCHDYVEELVFEIDVDWIDRYIEAEYGIMVKPLSQQPGFLEWEIIVSDSRPGEVSSIYYWQSEDAYRAIDQVFLSDLKATVGQAIPEQHIQFVAAIHTTNTRHRVRHVLSAELDDKEK